MSFHFFTTRTNRFLRRQRIVLVVIFIVMENHYSSSMLTTATMSNSRRVYNASSILPMNPTTTPVTDWLYSLTEEQFPWSTCSGPRSRRLFKLSGSKSAIAHLRDRHKRSKPLDRRQPSASSIQSKEVNHYS